MKRTDYTAESRAWQDTAAGGTSLAEGVGNTRTGPDSDTWPLASWELVPPGPHTVSEATAYLWSQATLGALCQPHKDPANPPPQIHRTATPTDPSQPCPVPPTSTHGWRCPPPQRALTALSPRQRLQLHCTGLLLQPPPASVVLMFPRRSVDLEGLWTPSM